MSGKFSSPAPRIRNSEDKLYQACLDACIEGIENLPVSKRQLRNATINPNNNTLITTTTPLNDITNNPSPKRTTTPPPDPTPAASLISPPPTPRQKGSSDAAMNRAPLHGAPTRGLGGSVRASPRGIQPPYGIQDARSMPHAPTTQDARSNFAVEPAANSGSFKLKKATVKIVGVAFGVPSRATPAAASSSPVPGPVKAKAKEVERHETAKSLSPVAAPTPVTIKAESPVSDTRVESAIDDLFARLSAKEFPISWSGIKQESPVRPTDNTFSFGDRASPPDTPVPVLDSYTANLSAKPVKPTESLSDTAAVSTDNVFDQPDKVAKKDRIMNAQQAEEISPADIEQQYLEKATVYLQALPADGNAPVQIIKAVSAKLRTAYAPNTSLSVDEAEKLKARYAFAILNYIKNTSGKSSTSESTKQTLQKSDGNMLHVYAKLVDEKYASLTDLSSIVKLSQIILDVLPKVELTDAPAKSKAEPTVASSEAKAKPVTITAATKSESKPLSEDPIDSMKAWPTQEKRESPSAYRACILKGVSDVKSINQLQALVWGGRLESIALPAPGSDFAIVRFLTPDACDKYFKATENGIEIQGDKTMVVFVEKQPSPTSINDVMRNCTEGDASRCIRALDAEEDLSDMMLMKLARGKGVNKREVDRIKQGKTARGRHYIEFRFATIYHALNFKRQLHEDDDWEHCTISYATDPCETAQGVHYKDEDE